FPTRSSSSLHRKTGGASIARTHFATNIWSCYGAAAWNLMNVMFDRAPCRGLEFSYQIIGGLHHRLIFNIPRGFVSAANANSNSAVTFACGKTRHGLHQLP